MSSSNRNRGRKKGKGVIGRIRKNKRWRWFENCKKRAVEGWKWRRQGR